MKRLLFLLFALVFILPFAASGQTVSSNSIDSARTYYVCPSSLSTCAYNGDGGQSATPSDSNTCLTKALPCATIAGARNKFLRKNINAVVTIQLADSSTSAYFPDNVEFSNVTAGRPYSSILERALSSRSDTYPTGYIWIRGNDSTPNNVNVTGAATAAGTTSTKRVAFVSRGSSLRVSSMKINYFRDDDGDSGAINCYSAHCYVEEINATSDYTGNDGSLISGFFGSVLHLGDQFNITNSGFVRANAGTIWQTYSPAGYASCACTADSAVFFMLTNEQSHGMFQGGTWTFSGTGAWFAQAAVTNSSINWNADAVTSITYNGANGTGLYATQGSKVWDGAGVSMTVTVTALSRRAQARSGSYIHYSGTTAATNADLADGGSFIANGTFPYAVSTTSTMPFFNIYGTTVLPLDLRRTNAGQMQIRMTAGGSNAWESPVINAERHRGTYASQSALSAGDDILTFNGAAWGSGSGSSATYNAAGTFYLEADGTTTSSSSPGRWKIGTTPASTTSPVDRIVVNSSGVTSLYKGADVASASTITPTGNLFHVTGTTGITAISTTNITAGTEITIIFDASLTVTNGASLMLAGAANFSATADDLLVLVYDGTKWREKCRSVN